MANSSMGFSVGALDRASTVFEKVADSVDGLTSKLRRLDRTTAAPTLDADDKQLRAKVAAAEKRVDDLKKKVEQDTPQLDLDIAEAEAKQRKLTSDLDKLRKAKVTPEVELKIAQAEAQLGRVNTQLEQLRAKKVTPQVHADLAAAQTDLAAFSAELSALDRRRVTVEVDANTDDANRKVQVLDKSFGAATIRVAALARAMGSLALPAAIVGLTPYIASLGASTVQAAGALWMLPAAAAAGGTAFAALKVGMSGFGEAMKNLDDPKKFAEAIAELSPAARDAANAVRGLVPAWTAMQQVVQQNLFTGVADALKVLAGNYLPVLQAGLGGAATAMRQLTLTTVGYLNAASTISSISSIFTNVNAAMSNLRTVGASIMSMFVDIAAVGATFLPDMASNWSSAAESAALFIGRARESGQLAQWIATARDTVNQLGRVLYNVGDILASVFSAGQASGESFLGMLERVTTTIRQALNTPEGAAALTGFFEQVRAVVGLLVDKLIALWPTISAAGGAFAALMAAAAPLSLVLVQMASTALVPILNAIQWLAPVLGPLAVGFLAVNAAVSAGSAIMSGWAAITKTAGVVSAVFSALIHPIATATKLWAAAQVALNAVMAMNPIGLVVIAIAALVAGLVLAWNHSETFRNVVIGAWEAIKNTASAVFGWLAGFLSGVWSGIVSTVTSVWDGVVNFFSTVTSAVVGFFQNWGTVILAVILPFIGIPLLIIQHWDSIVAFFAALPGRIAAFLSYLGTAVSEAAVAAWNWLVTATSNAIDAAVDFVTTLPNRISFALGFLAATLFKAAVSGWASFTTGLENAWVSTVAFFAALPARITAFLVGLGATIYTWAVTSWDQFTTGLTAAWAATVAWFAALPSRIAAFLIGLGVTLYVQAVSAWARFTAGLSAAWAATVAWFAVLPSRITTFLIGLGATIYASAVMAWDGFTTGLTAAWASTVAWFVGLPAAIGGFFSDAGTWLLQTGQWLVDGLWNGLVNGWNGLVGWVGGLITSFIDGFKAGLGVASPSTIFAEIGGFLIQGLIQGIQTVAAGLWAIITSIATGVVNFFMAGIQGLAAMWSTVWNGIVFVFQTVWTTIQTVALTIWGWIQSYFTTSLAAYRLMWSMIWNGIVTVFTTVWNFIRNIAVTVWNAIVAFFTTAFAAYRAMFQAVWTTIQTVFSTVWNWIRNIAMTVWNAISAFFVTAFNTYRAMFQTVWTTIQTIFTTVWNWIKTTAMTIWNAILFFFQSAFAFYTTLFTTVWNNIVAIFTNIWNWLRNVATNAWNGIRSFFEGAFSAFTSFFQSTWQNIVNTFDRIWSTITGIASRVWDGVKNAFKTGVNAVIDVINIFADAINKVAGLLGFNIDLRIPRLADGGPISAASAGRAGTALAAARADGGPIGLASGGNTRFRRGGKLPYTGKNRDTLGAFAGRQPYALMGEEYVVRRSSTRSIGAAGMAAINNADNRPVDIVPRRSGGPVLPEKQARAHYPFLSALSDGQAEAVGAANAMGGRDRLLERLADGDFRAERAAGRAKQTMPGYRKQYNPHMLDPIMRDLGGAIAFAKSMSGKPYIWGGATTAGTDCSGYQGMITRVLRNQSPARIGTTATFPWPGFTPGLTSQYAVGAFKGNPGHMAGTLAGVNVESGGSPSRVKYGAGAVGADNGQFSTRASLPQVGGVFASGGEGGGGWSLRPLIEPLLKPIYDALTPVRDDAASGFGKRSMAGGGIKLMDGILAMADTMGGGSAGDVESWRPLVNSALSRVGQPGNLADITLRRMNQESGGDPRAINNWDINAIRGTPSKGLMQVIDPTFRAHRDPGLPNDIWDPMSNVVASMRYTLNRYGSLPAGYGRAGGYDRGGIARGKGMMMKDVITPERVLSGQQTRAFEQLVAALSSGRPQAHLANSGVLAQLASSQTTRRGTQVAAAGSGTVFNIDSITTPQGTSADQMAGALRREMRVARHAGVHG